MPSQYAFFSQKYSLGNYSIEEKDNVQYTLRIPFVGSKSVDFSKKKLIKKVNQQQQLEQQFGI